MTQAKPYAIPKRLVWDAYKKVKANRGAAGVDGQSLAMFDQNLADNLYKIWNRMSSGSYMPPAVRLVEIPKGNTGATRPLGIPTVSDRIAQMVVKLVMEPLVEPHFHPDSYGYRPGKSALDAVGVTRKRCWRKDWVIDLDIKGFFDNLDHDLVMRAVKHHVKEPWILLYVERWLKAPVEREGGIQETRDKGTPQGSVISPLLANLFMHYAFDDWLKRKYPNIQFARYADDAVVHAKSLTEAEELLKALRNRMEECGLELHPEKTRIVYCQDSDRKGEYEHIAFDFLGYTFRPRRAKNWRGKMFISFLPGVSQKAAKTIRAKMRSWKLGGTRNNQSLEDLARVVNPVVRGWINYYGRYYPSALTPVLRDLDRALVHWACRKYKRLTRHRRRATHWLGRLARREPKLFAHWEAGIRPAAGS
jgi:group II intron reverse transcriptase/maturase